MLVMIICKSDEISMKSKAATHRDKVKYGLCKHDQEIIHYN